MQWCLQATLWWEFRELTNAFIVGQWRPPKSIRVEGFMNFLSSLTFEVQNRHWWRAWTNYCLMLDCPLCLLFSYLVNLNQCYHLIKAIEQLKNGVYSCCHRSRVARDFKNDQISKEIDWSCDWIAFMGWKIDDHCQKCKILSRNQTSWWGT